MKPNGYLVIHLVNKHKFSPIINAGDPLLIISPQKYAEKRITNSVVDFNNFKYKADFELNQSTGKFQEIFKFKNSNKVRQNEHIFHMENQSDILSMAKDVGFKLKDTIPLSKCGYEHQYLYVLYKPE